MLNLISLHEHPACKDPTARLVTSAVRRDAIYSTAGGFVAVYMQAAVEGYFPTQQAAENALTALTIGNGVA